MPVEIFVDCIDTRWHVLNDIHFLIKGIANKTFKMVHGKTSFSCKLLISVCLCDNEYIRDLNFKYRNKDRPTNVLSFPYYDLSLQTLEDILGSEPEVHLGDIFLSYEVIKEEAAKYNIPLINRLTHMLTHGLLHLLGYDHIAIKDAKIMEGLEGQIMDCFGMPNPYNE